ncbi:MAG TPA: hypothetical protein VF607_07405 [Verrucomicrobiae bacterium]
MKFQVVKKSLSVLAICSALGLGATLAQAEDKNSATSGSSDKDDSTYDWAYDDGDTSANTTSTATTSTATPANSNIVIFGTSLANQTPPAEANKDKHKHHPDDKDHHFTDPNDTTMSGT